MSSIREMIDGDDLFQSVAPPAGPEANLKDVVVLNPQGESLFRSVSVDLGSSLKDQGVQVQTQLSGVGVSAKLSPEKIEELREKGFQVVDDSPRSLLPNFPASTSVVSNPSSSTPAVPTLTRGGRSVAPQSLKAVPSQTWSLPSVDPVAMMGSQELAAKGANGHGEVVAILDSGFDLPELADHVVGYQDFATGSTEFRDGAGHGSHVAQQVLATAPEAKLLVGKVMGDKGEGRPSDILKGLQWVDQMHSLGTNISVCNLSLGEQSGSSPEMMQAIYRQIHKMSSEGIKVVAAAGNSGPNPGTITSPADSLDTIAVGAVLNPQVVSQFSARGAKDASTPRPDVVAPGEYIAAEVPTYSQLYRNAAGIQKLRDMEPQKLLEFVQARPQLLDAFGVSQELLNGSPYRLEQELKRALPPTGLMDGKVLAQGTSFAAPLTAGLIAALDSVQDLSTEETRQLLKGTAQHIEGYPSNAQGAGLVNGQKALEKLTKSA